MNQTPLRASAITLRIVSPQHCHLNIKTITLETMTLIIIRYESADGNKLTRTGEKKNGRAVINNNIAVLVSRVQTCFWVEKKMRTRD